MLLRSVVGNIADTLNPVNIPTYNVMDFKKATDRLKAEGIGLEDVAGALGVAYKTVQAFRLDPTSSGHRKPPAAWPQLLARLAEGRSHELADLAEELHALAAEDSGDRE